MKHSMVLFLCIQLWTSSLGLLLHPSMALATSCEPVVATMVSAQGTVEARRVQNTQWQAVQLQDTYCPGDTVRVQEKSRADVAMGNRAVLRLSANTTITLEDIKEEQTSMVSLLQGVAHFFSRGPRSLEVHTPFTMAGARGTEFFVSVDDTHTLLSIFEGTVWVANEAGGLTLSSGQSAIAEAGKAPVLQVIVRPRDAVQWALYYPQVLYSRPEALAVGTPWQEMVRTSMAFAMQGDIRKAFDSIKQVPEDIRDPYFFTYRASLLLSVGQVAEARADIAQALQLNANDSNALALQTIIAVVQNEPEQALRVAQRAVAVAPGSATAHLALSYAQQARFDLQGARASLVKAVELAPDNALAWARLAELWLSFGELSKTLEAAEKAAELEPHLARTQTVLGFAYLTQVKTPQARDAFTKAITLDQADPLPRLGLGLAKVRDGHVDEGSRDLEIAASLAHSDALVRSYLGKAYFEEKLTPRDEREYNVARQLDPKDPTPWFYAAIAKQTTNRPVEALHDLQKAIGLNDNRAVYRSRLLLDSDLAARSASLGRIYSDLGFQQLALVEGWKSVHTDPTNFSAHRLLADSYAVLPRHEIARVSELLQSQLLQPLNLTPIQPRLAESNLFLSSGGGPGALSFNEFNSLFNRDGVTLQVSGMVGEHDTFAGEGVVAGIYKKFSFSLGYSHFETDGFRLNSDQRDDIVNAFAQFEITPGTSIQAEYRYRDREQGDVQQRFFAPDFFRTLRDTQQQHIFRFGGHHTLSPGSIFLASFTYQDSDARLRTEDFPAPGDSTDIKIPEPAAGVELQHLLRLQDVNLQIGAGYFDVDRQDDTTFRFSPLVPGEPPSEIRFISNEGIRHFNLYAYADINLLSNVTATVGFSLDSLSGAEFDAEFDKDQINPKFGITWNPFPGTTVRAAVFRVLKRTLITDQTLEPTQVAGFNQFFDDSNLTEAWRYGGAIDQRFTSSLFGGVEFSRRELTVPGLDVSDPANPNPVSRDTDWKEYLGRAYVFWTPHPWLALKAEYHFERFEREGLGLGFTELDTHRVPLGIGFFHPSGLSASLTTTYRHQEGVFGEFLDPTGLRSGRDDFWLVDMAIAYRLPKRYGFITVGATNLLDEKFRFFEVDFDNPTILPTRTVFAKITLTFP